MAEKSKKPQKINKGDKKPEVIDEKNDKIENNGQENVKITTTQPEETPESTEQTKESETIPITPDPEPSSDWKTRFLKIHSYKLTKKLRSTSVQSILTST